MSKQLTKSGISSFIRGIRSVLISEKKKTKRLRGSSSSESISAENTGQSTYPSSTTLIRTLEQVFPDILKVRMKNEFTIVWTGAAGATNAFAVTGNGLHLSISGGVLSGAFPLATGNASPFYAIPQITSIYGAYRISCCRLKTVTQNTSAAVQDAAQLVQFPCTQTFIGGLGNINTFNAATINEYPYADKRFISGQTINNGVTTNRCMHTTKIYGLRYPSLLEDSSYSALLGANPPNVWYWVLVWFPTTNNNTTASTVVRVEYDIEWYSRNVLTVGSV